MRTEQACLWRRKCSVCIKQSREVGCVNEAMQRAEMLCNVVLGEWVSLEVTWINSKKVHSWRRYSLWCLPPFLNLPVNKTKANQINKIYARSSHVTELDYNTTRLALACFLLGNVVLTRVAVWLKRSLAVWAALLQQPWKTHRSVSGSSSSLYLHPTTVRKSSSNPCPAFPPPPVAAASPPPPKPNRAEDVATLLLRSLHLDVRPMGRHAFPDVTRSKTKAMDAAQV